jgi:predicted RNA-binding Zn ribbon-like protein
MEILEPLSERLKLEETYLCLDFVNTVNWRLGDHPEEELPGYPDLVRLMERVALVSPEEASRLLEQAEAHPDRAQAVYTRAIDLREALYRIFTAMTEETAPLQADLDLINREVGEAMAWGELCPASGGFTLQWKNDVTRLDGFLAPIARSAADLLTSGELDRLGVCPGEGGCGWIFFDTSRNHSRRWCTMESCGNRAKAKRHYRKSTKKDF